MAPTVWHEFTPLANECQAVNLGQGFPGWSAPDFVKQALHQATNANHNQYARSAGHMRLVQVLAKKYTKPLNRVGSGPNGAGIDPLTEVVVTTGATEALFGVTQGLLNPGDEVIVMEPSFDIYLAQVDMAGGVPKTIPLRAVDVEDDESGTSVNGEEKKMASNNSNSKAKKKMTKKKWVFDIEEFKNAFTPKTRMVLINTPHNPTGKVMTRSELEQIAEVVKAHPNVVVVTSCMSGR